VRGGVHGAVTLQFFLVQMLNGLSFGALLFFLASGFTLIFGLMRIVNLAHGSFYLLGGYTGLVTMRATGNFALAVLAGLVTVALIGLFTERVLLRIIRGQELLEVLLTVGVAFIIADLCLALFGGNPESVPQPRLLTGSAGVIGLQYPRYRLFVIACAVAVGVALFLLQNRTRLGAIVRAGVDDRETIAALGVNINLVFTAVFLLGAALAGVAGVIGGAVLPLLPGGDAEILLLSLVVVVIGGLGSLQGAALGSALVGLINTFGLALIPDLSYFVLFAPMALILMLRPSGLLGRE
jgi:branched-chain amino acid transport system permease protein